MVSVILLAIPALESTGDKPLVRAALIAGMIASMIGMAMRWITHRRHDRAEARRG
jgi:H+/Cl- antiporter ClcA